MFTCDSLTGHPSLFATPSYDVNRSFCSERNCVIGSGLTCCSSTTERFLSLIKLSCLISFDFFYSPCNAGVTGYFFISPAASSIHHIKYTRYKQSVRDASEIGRNNACIIQAHPLPPPPAGPPCQNNAPDLQNPNIKIIR